MSQEGATGEKKSKWVLFPNYPPPHHHSNQRLPQQFLSVPEKGIRFHERLSECGELNWGTRGDGKGGHKIICEGSSQESPQQGVMSSLTLALTYPCLLPSILAMFQQRKGNIRTWKKISIVKYLFYDKYILFIKIKTRTNQHNLLGSSNLLILANSFQFTYIGVTWWKRMRR